LVSFVQAGGEGDAVVHYPGGEVRVVGDDERYLSLELPRVPAPQEVYETVVVAGDQDRHLFGRVGEGDPPVHPVPVRERSEDLRKLVAGEAEALTLDLQSHEEGARVAHVLVGGEDVTVVHRDERRDRRDEALLVRAGDE
jgi:hypothetical protein